MKLSNAVYDFLKKVAQIYLPAIGAFYFTLAQIWHLPSAEEIVGTITAADALLGIILGISSSKYQNSPDQYDGQILMSTTAAGKKVYSLQLNDDVGALDGKKQVVFQMMPISQ